MIRVQTSAFTFVGTPAGELGLSNGVYDLPAVTYVAVGTNSPTWLTNAPSGTTVVVDAAGAVQLVDPPAVTEAVITGFVFGFGVLGMMMGLRWVWARMAGAMGAGREIAGGG